MAFKLCDHFDVIITFKTLSNTISEKKVIIYFDNLFDCGDPKHKNRNLTDNSIRDVILFKSLTV